MITKSRMFCAVLVISALTGYSLFAQEITVDWPGRTITSSPSEIHKGDTVKVTVSEVNNILYDYKVNVTFQIQAGGDDLAQLGKLIGLSVGPGANRFEPPATCQEALTNAKGTLTDLSAQLNDPKNYLLASASPTEAIPLKQSLEGWRVATNDNSKVTILDQDVAIVKNKCTGDESKSFLNDYDKFDKFRKKVEGPHTVEGQSVASSGEVSAVTVSITESYTDAGGKKHTVSTFSKTLNFSAVLNLSGGVLFSTLRHPTYVRQSIPGSADSVLGIDGGSQPVPMIVGLLNYKIPRMDFSTIGFALSSGPVLRVGGSSGTTGFGYFNGVSIHVWHRLFVTAGSHVGQFPDIPTGFKIGQTIPSSFGQLTPANRWSARFAVAVTYKTNDLGALTSQTKPAAKQDTSKPGTDAKSKTDTTDKSKSNNSDTPGTDNPKSKKKKFLGLF
jgi:hypothetical protein